MEPKFVFRSVLLAIEKNDLNQLKSILRNIPREKVTDILSGQDQYGNTPLLNAVKQRNLPVMRYLLADCHLNPMVTDRSGKGALYIAASQGELGIVKMLVDFGAKLDFSDHEDPVWSPLRVACFNNHQSIASFLIENGEDIDTSYCLIAALHTTSKQFIQYLLDFGADVNISYIGCTPLINCCQVGNLEILKIFAENGADHSRTYDGLTALQWAALKQQEHILSYYSNTDHYTREEVWTCYELLGVAAIIKLDLPSAITIWNKVLNERPRVENAVFESKIFRGFHIKLKQIESYDHLINDYENAAIHSMLILERAIGVENLQQNKYFGRLLKLLNVDKNLVAWESILIWITDNCISNIFYDAYHYFTFLFKLHVQSSHYKNISSSIVILFYRYFHASSTLFSHNSEPMPMSHFPIYDSILSLGVIILCSIKDDVPDFDSNMLYTHIKKVRNMMVLNDSLFHALIKDRIIWEFSDEIVNKTFELCCKICEPVNDLNHNQETPIFVALKHESSHKFVDTLLKYGAVTDTKTKTNESIRERACNVGRPDICLGASSLQILINAKLTSKSFYRVQERYLIDNFEIDDETPVVLKHFIRLH